MKNRNKKLPKANFRTEYAKMNYYLFCLLLYFRRIIELHKKLIGIISKYAGFSGGCLSVRFPYKCVKLFDYV